MRKLIFLIVLICAVVSVNAQGRAEYASISGNEVLKNADLTILLNFDNRTQVYKQSNKPLVDFAIQEASITDYETGQIRYYATRDGNCLVSYLRPLADNPVFEETGKTDSILGYLCHHAKTIVFGNTIEIWYASVNGISGSPWSSYQHGKDLIFKILRNGSYGAILQMFMMPTRQSIRVPENWGEETDQAGYRQFLNQAYIKRVEVFNNDSLYWGAENGKTSQLESGRSIHFAGGTFIMKKVKLPKITADYQLFAELSEWSAGDAYDRTGSVFFLMPGSEKAFFKALDMHPDSLPGIHGKDGKFYQGYVPKNTYFPPVEIMRFFTPFGVRQYNEKVKVNGIQWNDSVLYSQEISHLLPVLKGEIYIGAYIGNYDKGGHRINLNLKYFPGTLVIEEIPEENRFVLPLFNTVNILEMAGQAYSTLFIDDSLRIEFNVPEGSKDLKIIYTATGHGGWSEGDEFVRKEHRFYLDGNPLYHFTPWRTDCMCYRSSNPASGNFWNGLSSSDYSRSGWCPGSLSYPVEISLGKLSAGKHTLMLTIPAGKPDGNGFSFWNVSAVLVGIKDSN
ncbi:MAG: PNGase F N-terminal domain-containing protein [Bacteroidales bacterium]|nr:PNGase F N-terminal domain-containing protein [Bacteroidales bacterium]